MRHILKCSLALAFMAMLSSYASAQSVTKLCFPTGTSGQSCQYVTTANPLPTTATLSASALSVTVTNTATVPVIVSTPNGFGGVTGALNVTVTNTNANGQAMMANSSPVAIASDQTAIPATPSAGTTGGTTPYHLVAVGTTNSNSVKGSAGVVYSVQTGNINAATIAYLKFYDKATAPTCNSDTVVKTIVIPANSLGGGNNASMPVGWQFTTGIGICVTAGIADNDNTAVTAANVVINIGYK